MIVEIDRQTLGRIRNPEFRAHAGRYVRIYEQFMEQVRATGIAVAEAAGGEGPQGQGGQTGQHPPIRAEALRERLQNLGATVRNGGRSIYANRISPACVACQTGVGSVTFYLSLRCHRRCFYCFNPNQEGYEESQQQLRDCEGELEAIHDSGLRVEHVALTGGEPLLHREEAVRFFERARRLFPGVYTRLYTSGDMVTPELLQALRGAGLDEIRFSVRMHDAEGARRRALERITMAREHIPSVMVEMPVVPGTYEQMCQLLVELDRLAIFGINLLELGFPLANAEAFNRRGLRIKRRPYRVLYNYWYAGGLPVQGSEEEALALVAFAMERGLGLGVHYCSLENKNTGQLFQQNAAAVGGEEAVAVAQAAAAGGAPTGAGPCGGSGASGLHLFSARDFFLKSAKVFGGDVPRAIEAFRRAGYRGFRRNRELGFVEFHPAQVEALRGLALEVGISYNVLEVREGGEYLRELKLDLAYPERFDPGADL